MPTKEVKETKHTHIHTHTTHTHTYTHSHIHRHSRATGGGAAPLIQQTRMRERHRAYVRELSLVQWTRHGGERVAGHVAVSLKEGRISYELGQTLDAQEPRVRIQAFQVLRMEL